MSGLLLIEQRQSKGVPAMSKSIAFYHGRDNVFHAVDTDNLPIAQNLQVIDFVVAVINAGFHGVVVDETKLSDGRFIQCISANQDTPEGQIVQALAITADLGKPMPSIDFVLEKIKKIYADLGGGNV
jgi:hypothetical protein